MIFCGMLQRHLSKTTKCPFSKNVCMWRNAKTGKCCYTSRHLTLSEYCSLVNKKIPSETDLEDRQNKLKSLLKDFNLS